MNQTTKVSGLIEKGLRTHRERSPDPSQTVYGPIIERPAGQTHSTSASPPAVAGPPPQIFFRGPHGLLLPAIFGYLELDPFDRQAGGRGTVRGRPAPPHRGTISAATVTMNPPAPKLLVMSFGAKKKCICAYVRMRTCFASRGGLGRRRRWPPARAGGVAGVLGLVAGQLLLKATSIY